MPVIGTPLETATLPTTGVVATPAPGLPEPCCGTPGQQVLLSAVTCADQQTVTANTTSLARQSLYMRQKAVIVRGGQTAVIQWQMTDRNGTPIDLSECVCDDATEDSESSESECDFQLKFRIREQVIGHCATELTVDIADEDVANGIVHITLPPEITSVPGLYYGEVAAFSTVDDEELLVFSNIFTVIIERGSWSANRNGPPSFAEIRLHLRDSDPAESRLLDGVTFDDAEIALAIQRPIQYWNEIPPDVKRYSTASFPHRYHWLEAIAGELFLMASEGYRKNHLAYSAAGISVDDQNKEPNYEQAAARRLAGWKDFVRRKKAEINLNAAWGEVGSQYGYGRTY